MTQLAVLVGVRRDGELAISDIEIAPTSTARRGTGDMPLAVISSVPGWVVAGGPADIELSEIQLADASGSATDAEQPGDGFVLLAGRDAVELRGLIESGVVGTSLPLAGGRERDRVLPISRWGKGAKDVASGFLHAVVNGDQESAMRFVVPGAPSTFLTPLLRLASEEGLAARIAIDQTPYGYSGSLQGLHGEGQIQVFLSDAATDNLVYNYVYVAADLLRPVDAGA